MTRAVWRVMRRPARSRSASHRLLAAIALFALPACAASAAFHSKNGQIYTQETPRAVTCEEGEVATILGVGAFPIGTIEGKAISFQATDADVMEEAASVAARSGGTHVLRTDRGVESYTFSRPAQRDQTCTRDDERVECTTTWTPPSTTTLEKPTGRFVVFRAPPASWSRLPEPLRPRESE